MVKTPAVIGQTYQLPPALISEAQRRFVKPTLILGMPPQWLHDSLYAQAGIEFHTPDRYAEYDRAVDGVWYDDKVCTFLNKDGIIGTTRSFTHSVTYREQPVWDQRRKLGIDTLIPSWDYVDNTHTAVIFRGVLSYMKIRAHPRAWQDAGYFYVEPARRDCQAT